MKSTMIKFASISAAVLSIGAGSKHKAHQHGVAELDIAVETKESTIVNLELESPAEAIYGFEHRPKTDADKAKIEAANAKLGTEILNMVKFDSSLGCTAQAPKIEHEFDEDDKASADKTKKHKHHGEHSEVHAEFTVTCQKPVAGSSISFDFTSSFPGLKSVKVQAVVGGTQSGVTVKKAGTSLKI